MRRRLFPKITVTVLDPVKFKVDPELKGRKRRQAAGAALYTIMSDLIYRTTPTDHTVIEELIEAAKLHGPNWLAIEDPVSGQLSYKRLLLAMSILGRKLMPLAGEGRALGVMMPTSNAGVVTMLAVMSAGGCRHDQFLLRRRQYSRRLSRRGSRHHPDLAHLRRKGPSSNIDGAARETAAHRLP